MFEVHVGQRDIRQLEPFVGAEQIERALAAAAAFRDWLGHRTIWNVSSTAVGGGVAEMLEPLVSYSKSLGVSIRWLVMEGSEAFFRLTKRLHHAVHGSTGDGSPLGAEERHVYQEVSGQNAAALAETVGRHDIVLLHDPQTAGLAPPLAKAGALVIWRCHIGHDRPSEEVDRGWRFLGPWLEHAHAYVFSREGYVPPQFDRQRTNVVQPSIDAMSPKNQPLLAGAVRAILRQVSILGGSRAGALPHFTRTDGTTGQVVRQADVLRHGPPPPDDAPLVVQISRWDPLKDMAGVMQAFAALVEDGRAGRAHLLLAGPDVRGVQDDPEAPAVFGEAVAAWNRLAEPVRARIALCTLPTADIEENAAIVNAIQRHAAVVTQKSLREGFGLTVAEAMWKSRPVIGSAVGGICDQIEHRMSGLLLDDPRDLRTFAGYIQELLEDAGGIAQRLGAAARERVRDRYLGVRHLLQYAELMRRVDLMRHVA
jgi:trehalose synthase